MGVVQLLAPGSRLRIGRFAGLGLADSRNEKHNHQADRKEANMRPGARVFPTATKHHSETSVDSRLM